MTNPMQDNYLKPKIKHGLGYSEFYRVMPKKYI